MQQLLTVKSDTKCVNCCCCTMDNQYTGEHHTLGELLRSSITKRSNLWGICPCSVSDAYFDNHLFGSLIDDARTGHFRRARISWKLEVCFDNQSLIEIIFNLIIEQQRVDYAA